MAGKPQVTGSASIGFMDTSAGVKTIMGGMFKAANRAAHIISQDLETVQGFEKHDWSFRPWVDCSHASMCFCRYAAWLGSARVQLSTSTSQRKAQYCSSSLSLCTLLPTSRISCSCIHAGMLLMHACSL